MFKASGRKELFLTPSSSSSGCRPTQLLGNGLDPTSAILEGRHVPVAFLASCGLLPKPLGHGRGHLCHTLLL